MQLGGGALVGLAIDEDDLEFTWRNNGAGREGPSRQIRVVVGQKVAVQSQIGRPGIIEFDLWIMLCSAVGDSVKIIGLHFVNPKQGIRRQARNDRVAGSDGGEYRPICCHQGETGSRQAAHSDIAAEDRFVPKANRT